MVIIIYQAVDKFFYAVIFVMPEKEGIQYHGKRLDSRLRISGMTDKEVDFMDRL